MRKILAIAAVCSVGLLASHAEAGMCDVKSVDALGYCYGLWSTDLGTKSLDPNVLSCCGMKMGSFNACTDVTGNASICYPSSKMMSQADCGTPAMGTNPKPGEQPLCGSCCQKQIVAMLQVSVGVGPAGNWKVSGDISIAGQCGARETNVKQCAAGEKDNTHKASGTYATMTGQAMAVISYMAAAGVKLTGPGLGDNGFSLAAGCTSVGDPQQGYVAGTDSCET